MRARKQIDAWNRITVYLSTVVPIYCFQEIRPYFRTPYAHDYYYQLTRTVRQLITKGEMKNV